MLCLLGLLLFSMLLILLVAGMEDLDGMKVDYGANARLSVLGTPDFCSAPWGQPMVLAFSCTAEDAAWPGTQSFGPRSMEHTSVEFFLPSQFLFVLGAAGRRVSLARCADDPGSPVGSALALGGPPQDGCTAGVCGCGTSPRRVLALRDGGGDPLRWT